MNTTDQNATLCEDCFPTHSVHAILAVAPMGLTCDECGLHDASHCEGLHVHRYRGDPRIAPARDPRSTSN